MNLYDFIIIIHLLVIYAIWMMAILMENRTNFNLNRNNRHEKDNGN